MKRSSEEVECTDQEGSSEGHKKSKSWDKEYDICPWTMDDINFCCPHKDRMHFGRGGCPSCGHDICPNDDYSHFHEVGCPSCMMEHHKDGHDYEKPLWDPAKRIYEESEDDSIWGETKQLMRDVSGHLVEVKFQAHLGRPRANLHYIFSGAGDAQETFREIKRRFKETKKELDDTNSRLEDIIANKEEALNRIRKYGGIDGAHHKQWVLDQVVRCLNGYATYSEENEEAYKIWVRMYEYNINSDGEEVEVDEWNAGIAP